MKLQKPGTLFAPPFWRALPAALTGSGLAKFARLFLLAFVATLATAQLAEGAIILPTSTVVTLNANGGSGGTTTVTATYGEPMPSATAPTRAGYSFQGYMLGLSASDRYYTATMASARNWDQYVSTATLTALWLTATTYTVTLNANGGSGGTASVTATANAAMPSATAPTRTGYIFAGYYNTSASTGGTQYYTAAMASAHTWDTAGAGTLYARWTAATYTVTLDRNGGSGGTASVTATYSAAMPSATAPTRSGYTFAGYADSGGTYYYTAGMASAHTWDKTANTTLYAQWTANPTYTVTLDRNGGSGGTASVTPTYGAAMPSATAPTRTGYTFAGYSDSGGTQYYTSTMTSARNWDKSAAATLYAQWTAGTYAVSFDVSSNGGSGGQSAAVTATYGSAMPTISTTAPTKTGYTFTGWYDAASGGTQYYNAAGSSVKTYDKAATATLYAQFTANTYTVTFDANNGTTANPASKSVTYGAVYGTLASTTRTGYTFSGWFTSASGGTKVLDTTTVSNTANHTLYAQWTADTYTVTFDANSGTTANPTSKSVTYGAAYGTLATTTRTGYTFAGWFTSASGGTKVLDTTTVSNTANHTLYAQWTADTYTVTFDANGGSGGTTSVSATYDSDMPGATAPTLTGYTFVGYFDTSASTGGTQYYTASMASTRIWDKTAAATLHARWTVNTYTVTLNANGGSGGTASVTATYGSAMPDATAPTQTGYTFVGYFDTSASTGGTQYYTAAMASARTWDKTAADTLHARWMALATIGAFAVANPETPTATIGANPQTGSAPLDSTLTWTTGNAASVTVSGPGMTTSTAASGSHSLTDLAQGTHTYTVTAQPQTSATLTWSTTDANTLTLVLPDGGTVNVTGQTNYTATAAGSYTLKAANAPGSEVTSTSVTVTLPVLKTASVTITVEKHLPTIPPKIDDGTIVVIPDPANPGGIIIDGGIEPVDPENPDQSQAFEADMVTLYTATDILGTWSLAAQGSYEIAIAPDGKSFTIVIDPAADAARFYRVATTLQPVDTFGAPVAGDTVIFNTVIFGSYKVSVPAMGSKLLSRQLVNPAQLTVADLFTTLTPGSVIEFPLQGLQARNSPVNGSVWISGGSIAIDETTIFSVQNNRNQVSDARIVGRVPEGVTNAAIQQEIAGGATVYSASRVPAAGSPERLGLAGVSGDFIWCLSGGVLSQHWFVPVPPPARWNVVPAIDVGDAFWIQRSATRTWSQRLEVRTDETTVRLHNTD
ncbi:MAG: InlB B-repeat-containing protein [Opitutaceae bacterium]|jgi:uncharacterized repeat protein (TIGR02543 family)|nr:InlB B-repeat-containing protein [Opitutaceae bacterium]